MRTFCLRGAVLLAILCSLVPGRLRASVVTIPDDYPSIQTAIDVGADTVLVRQGDYSEIPQANRGVVLLGIGTRRPIIAGLVISNPYSALSRQWRVEDVDFTGPVSIQTPNYQARLLDIAFARCRLAAGVQHDLNTSSNPNDIRYFSLSHCYLGGPSAGRSSNLDMRSDTVTAGFSWGVLEIVTVESSWFSGGFREALLITGDVVIGSFVGNIFEDAPNGFRLGNCEDVVIRSNVVRRTPGIGMELMGKRVTVADNNISDCGIGLWYGFGEITLTDNTILRATGNATYFDVPDFVHADRNVIGRCGGNAVAIQSPFMSDLRFRRNTFYDVGSSAIRIGDGADNTLTSEANIGFRLGAWGIFAYTTFRSSALSCNDWVATGSGTVSGVAVSGQDLEVDPGFCDVADDDVRLYSDSPLLSQSQCPQIGARGIGCSPPALRALSVESSQGGLGVAWEFEATSLVETWIERADHLSGPWDSLGTGTSAASNEFELVDHAVAPDRDYYYRAAWKDRGAEVRGSPAKGTWTDAGRLSSVSPNPTFGEVKVDWVLARPGTTDIRVYDLAGREVTVVAQGSFGVGRHQARWDGQWAGGGIAPAGMYVVRISNAERTTSHRILLLR